MNETCLAFITIIVFLVFGGLMMLQWLDEEKADAASDRKARELLAFKRLMEELQEARIKAFSDQISKMETEIERRKKRSEELLAHLKLFPSDAIAHAEFRALMSAPLPHPVWL